MAVPKETPKCILCPNLKTLRFVTLSQLFYKLYFSIFMKFKHSSLLGQFQHLYSNLILKHKLHLPNGQTLNTSETDGGALVIGSFVLLLNYFFIDSIKGFSFGRMNFLVQILCRDFTIMINSSELLSTIRITQRICKQILFLSLSRCVLVYKFNSKSCRFSTHCTLQKGMAIALVTVSLAPFSSISLQKFMILSWKVNESISSKYLVFWRFLYFNTELL